MACDFNPAPHQPAAGAAKHTAQRRPGRAAWVLHQHSPAAAATAITGAAFSQSSSSQLSPMAGCCDCDAGAGGVRGACDAILVGCGNGLLPRSDQAPKSTTRRAAGCTQEPPPSWARSPLSCHDCARLFAQAAKMSLLPGRQSTLGRAGAVSPASTASVRCVRSRQTARKCVVRATLLREAGEHLVLACRRPRGQMSRGNAGGGPSSWWMPPAIAAATARGRQPPSLRAWSSILGAHPDDLGAGVAPAALQCPPGPPPPSTPSSCLSRTCSRVACQVGWMAVREAVLRGGARPAHTAAGSGATHNPPRRRPPPPRAGEQYSLDQVLYRSEDGGLLDVAHDMKVGGCPRRGQQRACPAPACPTHQPTRLGSLPPRAVCCRLCPTMARSTGRSCLTAAWAPPGGRMAAACGPRRSGCCR
jgi:hypothetical protein